MTNEDITHQHFLRTGPQILIGLTILGVTLVGTVAWGLTARLDGAVLAPGRIGVEGKRKQIQHQFGGTIDDILVREGDRVAKDQILIRMQPTNEKARVAVLRDQLLELSVRRARLLAERGGANIIKLPDVAVSPGLSDVIAGQRNLFDSRRAARDGEVRLIKQRIARLNQQVDGLKAQRSSNNRQVAFVFQELKGLRRLARVRLVTRRRLLALEREAERIKGLTGSLTAQIAQSRNAIDELGIQRAQLVRRHEEQVTTELRDLEPTILSLWEQFVAARQKLSATVIRAPVAGTIVELKVNTIGGVVTPGANVLDIVPKGGKLLIRTQVAVTDIDRIAVGMSARIRLTAFDAATTPEARGKVVAVSADSLSDGAQSAYYEALVDLRTDQPAVIKSLDLVPGMPAEVFIQTGKRNALSYLIKPLSDRLARAFIED